jgi:hypothetical protein
MSKFFSWLGTIFFFLVIIAAITSPGDKKFENFVMKDKGGDTMRCKPVIAKSSEVKVFVRLCSFQYVDYCELTNVPAKLVPLKKLGDKFKADTTAARTSYSLRRITKSENYLGLFGRFWKL